MIIFYRVLTTLLFPFLIIFIYFRKLFNREEQARYKEKIFSSYFNVDRDQKKKLIWFHAVSVGELNSIIPIIEELNNKYKDLEFLITTTTLSSSTIFKKKFKRIYNIRHRFFPLDVAFLVKKFLKSWSPSLIFFVDSEIWPNLLIEAQRSKIPLGLINARITTKSAKRWMKFPKSAEKIFSLFNFCLVANSETKNFLEKLNVKNLFYNGNIKLATSIYPNKIKGVNDKFLISKRFWLAASTHKDEDHFCLKTHFLLKKKYPDIITIIAPRHINRVKKIKDLAEKFNFSVQTLNEGEKITNEKEIILINAFGVLDEYFKFAKSVFIGKSMIKRLKDEGGQNPINAAKLGCKVYHGPYVYNFQDIYNILKKNKISKKIENAEDLNNNLMKDLEILGEKNNNISNIVNDLGQKTLLATMRDLNNFLNEIK